MHGQLKSFGGLSIRKKKKGLGVLIKYFLLAVLQSLLPLEWSTIWNSHHEQWCFSPASILENAINVCPFLGLYVSIAWSSFMADELWSRGEAKSHRTHGNLCEPHPQVAPSSINIALNGALSCHVEKQPSRFCWLLIYVAVLKIITWTKSPELGNPAQASVLDSAVIPYHLCPTTSGQFGPMSRSSGSRVSPSVRPVN